ncbi:MAG: Iron-sulfur cluster assembly scaffold protein IscU [Gemmatimonadaceae bacterium]|nr:Iron-sulfur cluster assembly scaffold protein IscU [Gemmatimonadaceae bacterium]
MSTDTGELYQEIILDHNRSPRNWGPLADASAHVKGHNPLCGDRLELFVRFDGDRVADVSFVGEGCAISKASASMMTQAIKGKSRAEAEALFERFHALVTGTGDAESQKSLGRLQVFSGVARLPMRVKCASLAWHALHEALQESAPNPSPPTDAR